MSVNPVAAGYIEAQTLCGELGEAQRRLRAAWRLYELALERLGPFPRTDFGVRKLAERERCVSVALGGVRACGLRLGGVGVGTLERASARRARLAPQRAGGPSDRAQRGSEVPRPQAGEVPRPRAAAGPELLPAA